MNVKYLISGMLMIFISCRNKVNQYEKFENKQRRIGKWIEMDSVDNDIYTTKGRYKNGEKVGVWKTYFNQKLYQKDKIKDSVTKTKIYFPDGKIMEKGQTKLIAEKNFQHWFYFGEWNYYDEKGKVKYKKIYRLNQKTDSISYQNRGK